MGLFIRKGLTVEDVRLPAYQCNQVLSGFSIGIRILQNIGKFLTQSIRRSVRQKLKIAPVDIISINFPSSNRYSRHRLLVYCKIINFSTKSES